ncbi:MAG TPA: carboxypeptidase regulatory-like domain-containing protein, partial [Pyrinomonadaceae bacterium]|nr:carboxypeptidase regulatory-like domain-containing protein [Pyrinomonadaceae bacterium]
MPSNDLLRPTKARARRLSCALFAFACALAPHLNLHAQTPAKENKGSAVVAGRVVCEEHGVAGVLVTLMPASSTGMGPPQPAAKATTDTDGRYRLTNVPVGSYYLSAATPAYVSPDANLLTARQGRLLNITAGDQLEALDFTLMRGGVITGRVMNADGKPVVEARIQLVAAADANSQNQQTIFPPFSFQTDDRGVYRVYGLAAGRYLVSVGEGQDARIYGIARGGSSYIPHTYYGDTSDVAQAKPVEVTAGAETSGVDITVGKSARTYEAAGRVVDERGQPVAGAVLISNLLNADGRVTGNFMAGNSRTNERGEFHLKGFLPGRYGLYASQGQPFEQDQ